jgi:carbonic anhydrase
MKKGNERFRSGVRQNRNYLNEQKASASGQYPAAALLSCIDSRAPAEVIMDLGLGDIFNCRVAGNVANPDILGSMEFACKWQAPK